MRDRFWLLLPAFVLYCVDFAFTLAGQPPEYWAGDYSRVTEYNPIAYPLLAYHPGLFVGAVVAWGMAVGVFVLLSRRQFAGWAAVLQAIGSAVGGASWLARRGSEGWAFAVAYLVVAAWLSGICWRRAGLGSGGGA